MTINAAEIVTSYSHKFTVLEKTSHLHCISLILLSASTAMFSISQLENVV